MAIYSREQPSDPRILSGLLACEVIDALTRQRHDERSKAFITNLLRLVHMYRYDTFTPHRSRGVLDMSLSKNRTKRKKIEASRYEALRTAMEEAHREIYGDADKNLVSNALEKVLTAYKRDQIENVTQEETDRAREFLVYFSRTLRETRV